MDPSNFISDELFEGFGVGDLNTWNGPAEGHSLEDAFHGARFVSVVDIGVIHYDTILHKTS